MDNQENDPQPVFVHVEPVLCVKNITETIAYWHNVLGFPGKWTWGDPPDHGGVSWHDVSVQFSLNPELASVSEGHSIWIRVKNIRTLYKLHQKKGIHIALPLENKPWGMTQYTIREINGYYLSFADQISDREAVSKQLPGNIRIVHRKPTISEYRKLISSVGWSTTASDEVLRFQLSAVLHAVVAEDIATEEAVGCVLLLGDNVSFYYVKDMMVHPYWQGQRVGTAMMRAISQWLDTHASAGALAGLFTGEGLADFYQQAGFSKAFGMNKIIRQREGQ
ncbi:GNAT family N-acetyltransferase [Dyadobacter sp. LHD-138]|uniref:GNAT family N-acetyltransferase n=1 Tax=Dyadobacter sp. LHD-138 TaxID=3071413 RepID=UPI0027DF60FA|nr:GNAT family N-acetyltransferase [Dyadobacter sp. LHD-138]MDQ6480302.1 GNAT family N-acetyltransferase [Dyadobacter sp. LHD-138]